MVSKPPRTSLGQSALPSLCTVSSFTSQPSLAASLRKAWPFSYVLMHSSPGLCPGPFPPSIMPFASCNTCPAVPSCLRGSRHRFISCEQHRFRCNPTYRRTCVPEYARCNTQGLSQLPESLPTRWVVEKPSTVGTISTRPPLASTSAYPTT